MNKTLLRIKETLFESPLYEQLKSIIKENGFIDFKFGDYYAKVYNPKLAAILCVEDLLVSERGSKDEKTVKTLEWVKTYIKGFQEGAVYFEKTFTIAALYGNHSSEFVKNLLVNYNDSWASHKNRYPKILDHDLMKELGYYSGIVNCADNMVETHHSIFSKCVELSSSNKNDGPKNEDKLTGPLLATIHWLNSDPIPKNCEALASKHGLTASYLYKAYLNIVNDTQHRRNIDRLNHARQYISKPAALKLLDEEIKETKK